MLDQYSAVVRCCLLLVLVQCVSCAELPIVEAPRSLDESTSDSEIVYDWTKVVYSPLVTSFAAESDNVQNNASSTLYLQTWSTLRLAPEPNPDGLYFGDSIARFWDTTLDSHKSAIASGHRLNSQVVLWGSAKNYLGGLLIDGNISVAGFRDTDKLAYAEWSAEIGDKEFRVAFPSREINWGASLIGESIVAELEQPFNGVEIYKSLDYSEVIGSMSATVRALQFWNGGAKVRDRLDTGEIGEGYIKFRALGSRNRSHFVRVAGGIVRLMRGDYTGAQEFFDDIIDSADEIRVSNEITVRLLRGRCLELQGKSGLSDFRFAFEKNPYSPTSIEHYLAGILSMTNEVDVLLKQDLVKTVMDEYGVYLEPNSDFHTLLDSNI